MQLCYGRDKNQFFWHYFILSRCQRKSRHVHMPSSASACNGQTKWNPCGFVLVYMARALNMSQNTDTHCLYHTQMDQLSQKFQNSPTYCKKKSPDTANEIQSPRSGVSKQKRISVCVWLITCASMCVTVSNRLRQTDRSHSTIASRAGTKAGSTL